MKEYIEKAALLEDLNHAGILSEFVKFKIERFPAADVAEVVRCAQCKHARESKDAFDWDGKTTLCECAYMTQPNRWHEYCSWGKRKEDEHEAG